MVPSTNGGRCRKSLETTDLDSTLHVSGQSVVRDI